jgi:hypothetical protein
VAGAHILPCCRAQGEQADEQNHLLRRHSFLLTVTVFVKRKSRHLIIKNRGSGVKREKE